MAHNGEGPATWNGVSGGGAFVFLGGLGTGSAGPLPARKPGERASAHHSEGPGRPACWPWSPPALPGTWALMRRQSLFGAVSFLNCGTSDHVGDEVRVAWDPGGLVEPDFAETRGSYRFFGVLAMVSEIVLVFLGEFTVALGGVLCAARRVGVARGPGTAGGPGVRGDRERRDPSGPR